MDAEAGWDIQPGTVLKRKEIHRLYGGRSQGGIGPSATTPNVFLFTDPVKGQQHGYYDGWGDDGFFYYTGEGQRGDQRMVQGNRTIVQHQRQGRALRLFRAVAGGVEYVGRFDIDQDSPWRVSEAPETGGGPLRAVIVFRIRPTGTVRRFAADLPATPKPVSRVDHVPVEARNTDRFDVTHTKTETTAQRREAELVDAYAQFLRSEGHQVCRLKIVPPQESRPLFTDLYDVTTREVIEAKGTVTREAIRMAVGQLLDYRRFVDPPPRTVLLLPSAPRPDLVDLCTSVGITTVWPDGQLWPRVSAPDRSGPSSEAAAQ